jgi:putative ubiquitin-RnfH superfamily antitoxin RatB of RatAB toxin-antitoxin module
MRVEVAYALPDAQYVIELTLADGATVADALSRVKTAPGFVDLDLDLEHMRVGIFGSVVADRTQRLEEGDRLEVYRPLTVDPMTARRLRANRKAV